jgi:hypothetical protein
LPKPFVELNEEEKAFLREARAWRGAMELDENGVDIGSIRENLKRTPAERVERGNRYGRLLVEALGRRVMERSCVLTPRRVALLDAYEDLGRPGRFTEAGRGLMRELVVKSLRAEYGMGGMWPMW